MMAKLIGGFIASQMMASSRHAPPVLRTGSG
jgi:hypothetical protein